MRAAIVPLVLVLPLIALGTEPEQRPAPRLLGAYYYPWYYRERWTREPVTNTPKLGWYSSEDRSIAAEHIRWARQADLDFFLISWLSPDGREGKNLKRAVLPELEQARFLLADGEVKNLLVGTAQNLLPSPDIYEEGRKKGIKHSEKLKASGCTEPDIQRAMRAIVQEAGPRPPMRSIDEQKRLLREKGFLPEQQAVEARP